MAIPADREAGRLRTRRCSPPPRRFGVKFSGKDSGGLCCRADLGEDRWRAEIVEEEPWSTDDIYGALGPLIG